MGATRGRLGQVLAWMPGRPGKPVVRGGAALPERADPSAQARSHGSSYGRLCTAFYDADKPSAPAATLAFYLAQARAAGGRVLEPMCGSGRFLLPMAQAGLAVDGVDASPAMVEACQAHARRLGIDVCVSVQALTALQLAHRYAMVFVPSGSIGLITDEHELRLALTRMRAHMAAGAKLFLELAAPEPAPSQPVASEPRTVACPDGTSITYACTVSAAAVPDAICFSGRYDQFAGTRLIATEHEELMLRMYAVGQVVDALARCGFGAISACTSAERPFLDDSGCTLVEARAVV